jgi:hypothetical protein
MKNQRRINAPACYEIRVAGHLSNNWSTRFEGLTMRHKPEGDTVLSGSLDQSALHGVLAKIRDLGLNLISINRVGTTEPSCLDAKDEHFQPKGE